MDLCVCVIALSYIMVRIKTVNYVSCGHAQHAHAVVDKILTHDYHVMIN